MATTLSPVLRASGVRDLGPQFVDNPHRMVGQDGAYSIPLSSGETLWFFGDTLVGERPAGQSLWYIFGKPVGGQDLTGKGPFEEMITNTGLILRDRTGRDGLRDFEYILNEHGGLKQLVPEFEDESPDKYRIWCQHGLEIGDRIYLSYIKVRMLEEGGDPFPVGFELVGSGLAVGSRIDWSFRRIEHRGDTILWKAGQPLFASAMLHVPEDGYVYLYGVFPKDGVQLCYQARVRPEELEHYERIEYFAGEGPVWTSDVNAAVPVMEGMPNEMSVSWNDHLGSYLAVHSLGLTGHVVGRTAPAPWGPWSEPVILHTVRPERAEPLPYPTLIYAGKEHPALAEDGGRVLYVTYIEFEEYFPHLLEITLE